MNALDRIIAAFSPAAALKRVGARAALDRATARSGQAVRAYEGAKTGRRTGGWITGSSSADAEVGSSAAKLRDRSRALCRDNPYASRARDTFVANVVGTGITAKPGDAKAAWDRWVNECDADGMLDFYGLQALAMRCIFESGECLIRYRERRPEDGLIVPLQLQVIEPDYLDSSKTGPLKGGGWMVSGVEYDAIGRRAAYWLFNQHPGDTVNRGIALESKRVPAEQVLHIFERQRPGQTRGVPRLSPILLKMRDLDDYEEAELVRKGIESCFSAIVTTEDTGSGLTEGTTDINGNRIETLGAGLIQYLKPGQDITFGAPAATGDYGDYTKTQLRAIAAGIGITYEQMTGDLSDVNYSSIRAGLVEFYKTVDMLQWHVLVPMMLQPIWTRWAATAWAVKAVARRPVERPVWTPPRRQWVDPSKEVAASRDEISANITSLSATIRARGEDPDRVFEEIAAERKRMNELGIASDLLPQPPAAPPADPQAEASKTLTLALARSMLSERKPGDTVIHNHPPSVSVGGAEIRNEIAVPPATVVNEIHERAAEAPVVHVVNDIHERATPAPVVNVAAPVVNVAAPEVTVENTVQPAAVELTLPARKTETTIQRDKAGNIIRATQVETDLEQPAT